MAMSEYSLNSSRSRLCSASVLDVRSWNACDFLRDGLGSSLARDATFCSNCQPAVW